MKTFIKTLSKISLIGLILVFSGCSEDDDDLPQVVSNFDFVINENSGTVTFENLSENADAYLWDFGDQTTSTEEAPIKTYESGTYLVNLTATNRAGASNTFTDTLTVVVKEVVSIPITFDDNDTNYEAFAFGGTQFSVVANPDQSGTNDKASNVGAITNSGATGEGISFALGRNINLETDRSITMNMWSESAVEVKARLEEGEDDDAEATANHGGSGWESVVFDFSSSDGFAVFTLLIDDTGSSAGAFFIDDVIQTVTIDTTPPVITLVGDANVTVILGEDYEELGATAMDNIDGDLTNDIIIDASAVDKDTEGTYIVTYNVTDAAGNAATEVERTVLVTDVDLVAPVITLNGDNPLTLTLGTSYNEPGATALDDVDGDITANIVIDNSAVNTSAAGSYIVTYNVSDAAGNAANEVERQVIVSAELLINGDFESGNIAWTGNAFNIQEDGGNNFNFANVMMAGNPFDVNISQTVELVPAGTYTLTFDASSDGNRSIIVGIGQSAAPFYADTETAALTTDTQTFTFNLTATDDGTGNDFGDATSRVLFDMGAEVGVVVLDNISLVQTGSGSGGGGSGGGGSGGGGSVEGNILTNPGFEDGQGDWLFFDNGGSVTLDNTENNGGTNSVRIDVTGPGGNPGLKRERFGIGTVQAGDVVQISFDHKGTLQGDGGVFGVLLFVERAEGEAGDPITVDFGANGQNPTLSTDWTTYTQTYTIPGDASVTGGLSLLIQGVCGPAGCGVTANIDNVAIVLNP